MIRLIFLILFLSSPLLHATTKHHHSLSVFSKQKYKTFQSLINSSLQGQAKAYFDEIAQKKRQNIFWTQKGKKNRYQEAFKRAYPVLKKVKTKGMPNVVLLIPSLESLWQAKNGNINGDYGYWQLVPSVVEEIKLLPKTPEKIKKATINKIRTDPNLSTETALIHLKRYFYFYHNRAKFPVADATFFSIISYNWGSGNVRRMLHQMQQMGIALSFSNFYHVLYNTHKQYPYDKSLQVAVEYLPNLWNLAKVVQQ